MGRRTEMTEKEIEHIANNPKWKRPDEVAQILADAMNQIEAAGYLVYPHPRPTAISIRVLRQGLKRAFHPDDTIVVARCLDEGDGKGWQAK